MASTGAGWVGWVVHTRRDHAAGYWRGVWTDRHDVLEGGAGTAGLQPVLPHGGGLRAPRAHRTLASHRGRRTGGLGGAVRGVSGRRGRAHVRVLRAPHAGVS